MENQVGERLADERVVKVIGAERTIAKNSEPTEGVIMIGSLAVELGGRGADRKNLWACPCSCRVAHSERLKVIAVLSIYRGHYHLPHGNRVPV